MKTLNKLLTTAVLLVCSLTSSAQTSVDLYRIDNTGGQTNIRNAPGGKIVDALPFDNEYNMLIDKIQNGWCHIVGGVVTPFDQSDRQLKGSTTGYWIHSSVVGATGMGDGGVKLYATPSKKAKVVFRSTDWTVVRPVEIKGDWIKVRVDGKKTTGWMRIDELCSNPVTNCC